MSYTVRSFLCGACLCLCATSIVAQGEANHWKFGECRALDFTNGAPVALADSTYYSLEGGSALSSPAGTLLLYTDGMVVWNSLGERLKNGQDLRANLSTTNAGLCIPRPGSDHHVYTITLEYNFKGMYYSIVDLRLDRGRGSLTEKNVVLLPTQTTEKMTAVHHANGHDIWLLTTRFGFNQKYAWLLTDTGFVYPPVISRVGPIHEALSTALGDMKVSYTGTRVAITDYLSRSVDLFDFNNTTGRFSNPRTINLPFASRQRKFPNPGSFDIYGVEFSLDTRMLYVSESGVLSDLFLFQVMLDSASSVDSSFVVHVIDSLPAVPHQRGYGLLQMAPDGKIYQALFNMGDSVGIINNPDGVASACNYGRVAFNFQDSLQGRPLFGLYGLPGFVQSFFNPLRFSQQSFCFNTESIFRISKMRTNDSVRWNFDDILSGDANATVGDVVSHRFSAPGDYWVTALLHKDGHIDTVRQLSRIHSLPNVLTSGDTAVCSGTTARLRSTPVGGRPPYLYRWDPADAVDDPTAQSPTAHPTVTTTYRVTVFDDFNCIAEDSVVVTVRTPPRLSAGGIVTICERDSIRIGGDVIGGTPPYRYAWSPSGGLLDSTQASHRISPSVSTVYRVLITDSAGCVASDSVRVEVLDSPELSATPLWRVCKGDSVTFDARIISGSTNLTITWSPSIGLSDTTLLSPVASPETTTLYTCTAIDSNGCDASATVMVEVSEAAPPVILGDTVFCEGSGARLEAGGEYSEYLWSTGERSRAIEVREEGSYALTVRDENGCNAEALVYVRKFPRPVVNISGPDTMYEGDTIILDAGDGSIAYEWSDGSTDRKLRVMSGGSYGVLITDSNGCRWGASHVVRMLARPAVLLALPDLEASPGDTVYIALNLLETRNVKNFTTLGIEGVLRFDRSVLHPLDVQFQDIGRERRVPVRSLLTFGEAGPLLNVPCLVTLGAVEETPLTLDALALYPPVFAGTVQPGRLRLILCGEGGVRLFEGERRLTLHQNHPNPFNASTLIRFDIIEQGRARLEVYDLYGRRVATLLDATMTPGTYVEAFDAASLASGQYLYVLRTPTSVLAKMLTVLK